MSYIIACNRPWCNGAMGRLDRLTNLEFTLINKKTQLTLGKLKEIKPKIIFLPFWSYFVPKEIYENYQCVIFHMTDLPFGRGGSPLQNLIISGNKNTMISAIKCVEEIDAGPVYLKRPLSLLGTADEIYFRASKIIEEMIVEILRSNPSPKPQVGEIIQFNRRKPEDGNLSGLESLEDAYNYIRMLDADGYPPAFIFKGKYKLQFNRPVRREDEIIADVKITMKNHNEKSQ